MSDQADDRFVTVAEAASLLGVSERTVRRYAGQVPDTDRQVPDKGAARFRLSALYKAARVERVPDSAGQSAGHETGTVPDNAGQVPDSAGQADAAISWRERALVAEARAELLAAERDRLADALAREQEIARLEAENHRAALMLAGRKSAPMLEGATVPDPNTGDTQPAREGEGGSMGRTEATGGGLHSNVRPSWWARLWGRG